MTALTDSPTALEYIVFEGAGDTRWLSKIGDKTLRKRWDPYDVWQRLLRDHPVCVEDPGSCTGAMDAASAREFWASVCDYPDPLQDALFVIAHARGFPAAIAALDQAIRDHLREGNLMGHEAAEPQPHHPVPVLRAPGFDVTDVIHHRSFASRVG